ARVGRRGRERRAPADRASSLAVASVSVIVPFRNAAATLERCVEALLDQTVPRDRYQLIFVDNGSTDGGSALLAGHPAVRVFEESRRGSYFARNRALGVADGEIIAFTDADCVVERDWLERVVAAMDEPGGGIGAGPGVPAGGGGRHTG